MLPSFFRRRLTKQRADKEAEATDPGPVKKRLNRRVQPLQKHFPVSRKSGAAREFDGLTDVGRGRELLQTFLCVGR